MDIPIGARRALIASVVLAIAIYAVAMIASDLSSVAAASANVGFIGWTSILALSLVNYGLRFLRWHGYLLRLGHSVPPLHSMTTYMAGFALTTTPGKAGEAVRCLFLRRYDVSYSQSLAVLFAERLLDLMVISVLALALASALDGAPLVIALGAVAAFLSLPLFRGFTSRWSTPSSEHRVNQPVPWRDRLQRLLGSSAALMAPVPWYGGFLLGLLAWAAEGFGLYLILSLIGAPLPLMQCIGVYGASMLVGALSFIPGGIGSTEATMVLLLTLFGLEPAQALAATLICRVATLWFAVALGLIAMSRLGAAPAESK